MAGMTLTAGMMEKRAELARRIKACLDAHGYGTFIVAEHIRRALLRSDSNEDRRHIMGSPVRYCRIAYEGGPAGNDLHAGGGAAQTAHRFGVMLWFHYADGGAGGGADAEEAEQSSSYRFDRVIESNDPDVPGLLPMLRAAGAWPIDTQNGEQVVYVSEPTDVVTYLVALDHQQKEFAHYLEFSIILT